MTHDNFDAVDPLDPDEAADEETLVGFFGRDGKWVTITELAEKGPVDGDVVEHVEALVDIDMLRVTRDDDGRPVSAQLTPFAVDLYDSDGTDEAVAVYFEYGKEPPEDLQEEYIEELHRKQEQRIEGLGR